MEMQKVTAEVSYSSEHPTQSLKTVPSKTAKMNMEVQST